MTERRPITDLAAYLDALPLGDRSSLRALGELLVGLTERADNEAEDASRFTARCLGVPHTGMTVTEEEMLSPVGSLTAALALAEVIAEHSGAVEVGPGMYTDPPAWTQTQVGDNIFHHPAVLRAGFPAGTLVDTAAVVAIRVREAHVHPPQLTVFAPREHRADARAALDRLLARARELNPYRGHSLRATYDRNLVLTVIDLPSSLTRHTVVVDEQIWHEIDLGLVAVRDRHELLNSHGLGSRRGVLLVGPPGTGKSAVSAAVAAAVVGEFTVIYVEARAGEHLLTAVVEEAQRLGGPVLLVLEDVDLWVRDRARHGGGGLSELLQAMDIQPDARILTLASTNDSATLDRAAVRTGRFDSIVEVHYPDRAASARIMDALLAGIPGGAAVDTNAVAAAIPEQTSGSDLREIVRRAVLAAPAGEPLGTAALLAEVGSGRYRAQLGAAGAYL